MSNNGTILVATDFSKFSNWAATRAAILCADLGFDSIELLNVKEGGLPEVLGHVLKNSPAAAETMVVDHVMSQLRLICGQLQDNYNVRCNSSVRFGQPEEEIVARAAELSPKLTVIGAHGGNFFRDLFLGSTADRLARLSKSPLLVVKNHTVQHYRQVLVPVDFSENSRCAAQFALEIAPNAHITFLHVFDVVMEEQMRHVSVADHLIHDYHVAAGEDARRDLNNFIAGLPAGNRSISRMSAFGHPGHVICDHADSTKPDLIVVGKQGRSRLDELLLGSVSLHVIEECTSDVLIVTASAFPGRSPINGSSPPPV